MNKVNLNEMPGYRVPTEQEKAGLAGWMRGYYAIRIKTGNVMSTILIVLGLIFFGSIGVNIQSPTVLSIILGLLCFFGAFKCVQIKRIAKDNFTLCENGAFRVWDGKITKVEATSQKASAVNVWFAADSGAFDHGWYLADERGVEVGTKAILVSFAGGKLQPHVFTPYMMTEAGARTSW